MVESWPAFDPASAAHDRLAATPTRLTRGAIDPYATFAVPNCFP